MSRFEPKLKSSRLKALPWAGLLRAGAVLGRRVGELSGKDRARLAQLLRDSRGWPGRLAPKERDELRKLLGKLDAKGMGRELLPLLRRGPAGGLLGKRRR